METGEPFLSLQDLAKVNPLPSGKWNQWKLDLPCLNPKPRGTRFPLGSGINGNLEGGNQGFLLEGGKPASLWEVESMETALCVYQPPRDKLTRFPLGSGINGNNYLFFPGGGVFRGPASLWEVESMETFFDLS